MRSAGLHVVITGTDSGLGLTLLHAFRSEGHTVIGSSTDAGSKEPYLNLMRDDGIASYAQKVAYQFNNEIDILINNAGVNGIAKFLDLTPEFLHQMMQVNCIGPVRLTQMLMPALRDGGRILNIISDAAHRPMRHSLGYNMSKAAFDMATKQMARELTKPLGVTIIGIRPGRMCKTGMSEYIDQQVCAMRGWTPAQCSEYFKANSVTGEEAWPQHVARLVYQIATSDLAPTMSGACLDLVG